MRTNKKISHDIRKRLDALLKNWPSANTPIPREGWIKNIRLALGMSSQEVGRRLQKNNSEILAIETRETQKNITLKTLDKVAKALGCQLIYALVPLEESSLETMLDTRAKKTATTLVKHTTQTMNLENQEVSAELTQDHINDLAQTLKQKLDPQLWKQ